jgi:hypothetical protein
MSQLRRGERPLQLAVVSATQTGRGGLRQYGITVLYLLLSFIFHMNSAEPKPVSDKVRRLTVMKSLLSDWHECNCERD